MPAGLAEAVLRSRSRRLVLHIGAPKTGSTAIQRFLRVNAHELATRHATHVPARFFHQRVRMLNVFAHGEGATDRDLKLLGISRSELGQRLEAYAATVRSALGGRAWPLTVISSELLFGLHRPQIQRVHDLLAGLFSNVTVVVYLRRQDELEVARWLQGFKRGTAGSQSRAPFDPYRLWRDYRAVLEDWMAVFGDHALTVRIYDRIDFPDGDIVQDFLRLLDLPLTVRMVVPREVNPTWGLEQIQLARLMNKRFPYVHDDQPRDARNTNRNRLIDLIDQMPSSVPYPVARHEAEAFYRQHAGTNAWLRDRFFPDRDRVFREDFGRYPELADTGGPPGPISRSALIDALEAMWAYHLESVSALEAEAERTRWLTRWFTPAQWAKLSPAVVRDSVARRLRRIVKGY